MKNGKWMNLFFIFCSGITGFVFMVLLYALFDIFGSSNSTNQSTIFSGLLSLIGGIFGALGAYFIARWQMGQLFNAQLKMEKYRVNQELEMKYIQELLQVVSELRIEIIKIKSSLKNIKYFNEENLGYINEFRKPENIEQRNLLEEKILKNREYVDKIVTEAMTYSSNIEIQRNYMYRYLFLFENDLWETSNVNKEYNTIVNSICLHNTKIQQILMVVEDIKLNKIILENESHLIKMYDLITNLNMELQERISLIISREKDNENDLLKV